MLVFIHLLIICICDLRYTEWCLSIRSYWKKYLLFAGNLLSKILREHYYKQHNFFIFSDWEPFNFIPYNGVGSFYLCMIEYFIIVLLLQMTKQARLKFDCHCYNKTTIKIYVYYLFTNWFNVHVLRVTTFAVVGVIENKCVKIK